MKKITQIVIAIAAACLLADCIGKAITTAPNMDVQDMQAAAWTSAFLNQLSNVH